MPLFDDILKFQHRVDQRANALADDLIKALEGAEDTLVGKLAAVQAKLGTDFGNATLKKRKRALEVQRSQVGAVLAEVYQGKAPHAVSGAASEVFEAMGTFTMAAGAKAFSMDVSPFTLDKAAVTLWAETGTVDGLVLNDWLAKLERNAADRILSVGRQAMVEGLGVDSMARMLRREGIKGSVPGLKGLARTFMLSAANHARDTTFEEVFGSVITGWRHVGTLDGRTCLRCGALEGRLYPMGMPKPMLPLHWSCRCLYVPVTALSEEVQDGTRAAVKHSERWVNHRDGSRSRKFTVEQVEQVPAGMTYETWLRGQLKDDPEFVRGVLGRGRFELFKEDKLGLSRMVTHGRVKPLWESQLK